ncbi:MAG: hypothetical protein CL438_10185 [Acidimicrobiaceae bacterium]|jgi:hypothetical protein|nr:hypothetical protein [Acidimicrobiaceae bacterium]|tara:strand:+ start:1557 stop:2351 length:795 start_codon:yes stop_codon:yes gene_type:complete
MLFFRTLKILFTLSLIAALCASCFKADFSMVVNTDGTGSIEGSMAISKKLGEVFGEESTDTEAFDCETAFEGEDTGVNLFEDIPGNATAEEFEDDEWCGFRFSADFTGFGQSLIDAGDDSFPLSVDGNILTFKWDEMLDDGSGLDNDSALGDDDMDPRLLLTLLGIPEPEYVISLELPGKIMEHNADEQVGSRLTWEIDLFETLDGSAAIPFAKANISMTSESTGSGGLRILWIIIGVVAGVLVLASLKFLQYQRDRDTEEDIL